MIQCTPDQEDFLDRVYTSNGHENMFTQTLALEMEYGVSPEEAQELIINWMKNYESRIQSRTNNRSNPSVFSQRRKDNQAEHRNVA
mgnify:CR=1 FL=1